MRESNPTEQSSASRLDVTLSIGIERACRGKEFEGENHDLRGVETHSSREEYGAREYRA